MLHAVEKAALRQPLGIRFPYRTARGMAGLATAEQPAPTQAPQALPVEPPVMATKVVERDEFWRVVPTYQDIAKKDFLSYRWSVS